MYRVRRIALCHGGELANKMEVMTAVIHYPRALRTRMMFAGFDVDSDDEREKEKKKAKAKKDAIKKVGCGYCHYY